MTDVNSPIMIGTKTLKNRITMAPTVKFIAGEDGMVTEKFVKHYGLRAAHECGLIVVEATCVSKEGRLSPTQLGLWCDEQIEGHKQIADEVHKYGALVIPQIHYGGLGTHPDCGPLTSPSKVVWNNGREQIEAVELSLADIARIQKAFVDAAIRAKKAGYDGVQLHGCHSYLINDFASLVNTRTDQYGGNLENMARFGCEIISAIRKECGEDFIISMRISGCDPTIDDSIQIAEHYVAAGCDYLQVSNGIGEFDQIVLPENSPYNKVAALGVKLHDHFKGRVPVSAVNGFRTAEQVRYMFENDLIDTIDLACGLLADPAFTEGILHDAPFVKCYSCPGCAYSPSHSHPCPAAKVRGVDPESDIIF